MDTGPTGRWSDHAVEQTIGRLLQIGVTIAALVTIAGGVLLLLQNGGTTPAFSVFHGEPSRLTSLAGIVRGAVAMQSDAIVDLFEAVQQIQQAIWPWLLQIPDVGAVRDAAAAAAAQGGSTSVPSAAAMTTAKTAPATANMAAARELTASPTTSSTAAQPLAFRNTCEMLRSVP